VNESYSTQVETKILPLLEKSIAMKQGQLVNLTEERVAPKAFQNSGLEESGLRNVLDVAKESPHVAIVTNFIRYQVGRDSAPGSTKWATKVTYKERHAATDEKTEDETERTMAIGEWVADDIEHTIARDVAAEVLEYVEAKLVGVLADEVKCSVAEQAAIRLTRSYLGYLLRAFVSAKG